MLRTEGNTKNNSINGRHRKDERRKEAYQRDAVNEKISIKDKLIRLNQINSDGAKRQRDRYEKALKDTINVEKTITKPKPVKHKRNS